MKKKQVISIIIMFAAVVLLALGYMLAKNYKDKKSEEKTAEEEAESETIDIYDIDKDKVVKISVMNSSGSFDIVLKDNEWVQEGTDVPMNSESVQGMLDAIADVDAIKVISEDGNNLAEYGLDAPQMSYTVTLSDDTQYTVRLGIALSTDVSAHYALLDSDTKVYSVSDNYYDPFDVDIISMTQIEDEVNINSEYITSVSVTDKNGLDFAAKYIGEQADNGYYKWEITKPYKDIFADTDTLNAQLEKYSAISYEKCVDYNCEDLSKYGLDKPYGTIRLDYYTVTGTEDSDENSEDEDSSDGTDTETDEAQATPVPEELREYYTYILYVGDKYTDGDEESYYVSPDGSGKVYTISAETVDGLFDFTPFSMADPCIYSELVDQLSGYDIEYKGKKYSVERREEKAEEGDAKEGKTDDDGMVNVYYVNGQKVDETEILTLYSAAYLLVLSGEADKSLMTNEDAVLTITYHPTASDDVVVKYIPYGNENFYSVDKNGMTYFLTDKRGIDDLISRYEKFMEDNKL